MIEAEKAIEESRKIEKSDFMIVDLSEKSVNKIIMKLYQKILFFMKMLLENSYDFINHEKFDKINEKIHNHVTQIKTKKEAETFYIHIENIS